MTAAPPGIGDVLVAVIAVFVACVVVAASVRAGLRGNWLAYVVALGAGAIAAGVAGQRTFPSAAEVRRLGQRAASTSVPGPWDAGVTLPGLPLHVTPVALGGFAVAAFGISLVLLFERRQAVPLRARPLRPLDEDDSV